MCGRAKMVEVNGKSRYMCHRATLPVAQRGVMLEPLENYGRWAYYCGKTGGGWRSKPCDCTEHTLLKK